MKQMIATHNYDVRIVALTIFVKQVFNVVDIVVWGDCCTDNLRQNNYLEWSGGLLH